MNLNEIKPGMRCCSLLVYEVVRPAQDGEMMNGGETIDNRLGNKFWGRQLHPRSNWELELLCFDLVGCERPFEDFKQLTDHGLLPHCKPVEPEKP